MWIFKLVRIERIELFCSINCISMFTHILITYFPSKIHRTEVWLGTFAQYCT